ncbi:Dynamin-related protein 4C [Dendrobium catenatum]|uniref:Dynamin-related protein 4C n=1 Tax=Dendrobium catenatum TaxID=906689 RepID=A0A2I0X022_9ASPA|nr:Dynamin-related protein 4C [Dendrobium catenatum]
MRLQHDPSLPSPILHLEYKGKHVPTSESSITSAIESATAEIAGSGKGISDTPLTLVVRKKGVPNLTIVDLPSITRVPVHGQPENIYEQIAAIIMQYIKPSESIILNVLSASADFPTCESIRMSQQVDGKGERTLAVVTKADKSSEGLLEKVTANDVNIGLGYVCVRNRIGSETYEETREAETNLFESHHLLSNIDKSIVRIPVLANKLMRIQAQSIAKCLPDIMKKINEKLNRNVSELETMPQNLVTVGDAMRAFMQNISKTKEVLRKLLIRREFDDFPDDKEMPNFLPRRAFLILLQKRVKEVSSIPQDFVEKVWIYLEDLVVAVLDEASENYPPLQACSRRAAINLIEKMRGRSIRNVKEIIEMEMVTDFTLSPDYMKKWMEANEQNPDSRTCNELIEGFCREDDGPIILVGSARANQDIHDFVIGTYHSTYKLKGLKQLWDALALESQLQRSSVKRDAYFVGSCFETFEILCGRTSAQTNYEEDANDENKIFDPGISFLLQQSFFF